MGQKQASYNASGAIIAFYDSADSPAPQGASVLDITDAQWQTCLSNPGWTVVNGALVAPPAPTAAQLLAQAQAAQIATLQASYKIAINAPVSFRNAAGVTSTYAFGSALSPGGTNAQSLLTQILSAGSAAWAAGVWADTTGKMQTMTFADLQGLAAAVEAMETPDEQKLMTLIAQVQAATTIAAVQAIVF